MDLNPISEEQMWEWVDKGTAKTHLERLKRDPGANPEDVELLEDVIGTHDQILNLPMFTPPVHFDAAVMSQLNASPAPILPLFWRIALPSAMSLAVIAIFFIEFEISASSIIDNWLGDLSLISFQIEGLNLVPLIFCAPMLLAFWLLDRTLTAIKQ